MSIKSAPPTGDAAGGDISGGDIEGGDIAGGDIAGGDDAGSDDAGSDDAGSDDAGSDEASGDDAGAGDASILVAGASVPGDASCRSPCAAGTARLSIGASGAARSRGRANERGAQTESTRSATSVLATEAPVTGASGAGGVRGFGGSSDRIHCGTTTCGARRHGCSFRCQGRTRSIVAVSASAAIRRSSPRVPSEAR